MVKTILFLYAPELSSKMVMKLKCLKRTVQNKGLGSSIVVDEKQIYQLQDQFESVEIGQLNIWFDIPLRKVDGTEQYKL